MCFMYEIAGCFSIQPEIAGLRVEHLYYVLNLLQQCVEDYIDMRLF
jgi:hypothetical protein